MMIDYDDDNNDDNDDSEANDDNVVIMTTITINNVTHLRMMIDYDNGKDD